jgi:exonuclease III
MKILSWNIMAGGGPRIPKILEAIAAHAPDTVALSEIVPGRVDELRGGLERLGHAHHFVPDITGRERGVMIASTAPFDALPHRRRQGLPAHRWAEVRFHRPALTLVNTYFPDTGLEIRAFWPRVHRACAELRAGSTLIVGDLNSGATAFDSEKAPLSSDPWFTAMPLHGFTDLWRLKHRDRREHTWFSRRGGKDLNGFRIDHAFGSEALRRRLRRCEYSHPERAELRLSDHSVLLVTIQ